MLNIDLELDIILRTFDKWYWDAVDAPEKRKKIDLVLSQVSEDMSLDLLVAFLAFTIPHKEEFKFRPRIVDMIKKKDPDRPGLWIGLE